MSSIRKTASTSGDFVPQTSYRGFAPGVHPRPPACVIFMCSPILNRAPPNKSWRRPWFSSVCVMQLWHFCHLSVGVLTILAKNFCCFINKSRSCLMQIPRRLTLRMCSLMADPSPWTDTNTSGVHTGSRLAVVSERARNLATQWGVWIGNFQSAIRSQYYTTKPHVIRVTKRERAVGLCNRHLFYEAGLRLLTIFYFN